MGLTPTPSSAEVLERVELYLYSPSGPSWPIKEGETYLNLIFAPATSFIRQFDCRSGRLT